MQQGTFGILIKSIVKPFEHLHLVDIAISLDHCPQDNYALDLFTHKVGRISRIDLLDCHRSREFAGLAYRTLQFSEAKNPASACRREIRGVERHRVVLPATEDLVVDMVPTNRRNRRSMGDASRRKINPRTGCRH